MRVLIAEDGRFARKVLATAVAELGHEAVATVDGAAAWEAIQAEHFDVLVTDWEMPGLTGIELCERVRSAGFDSYVYVIVLTAHSARDDRFVALSAGVDDLLTKPFDPAELAARLDVAGRILQWASQLQAVNDMLMDNARLLAEKNSEIERMREEAEFMANHDSLTGVLNRRAWMARVAGPRQPFTTIAMVDIDHFKRVNDTYGHPAGDAVLRAVALRLAGGPGMGARFGGEEFAIAFRCSYDEARAWCEQVLDEIAGAVVETESGPIQVTVSIGLAPIETDVEEAIRGADDALYGAKHAGRNRLGEGAALAA